MEPKNEDFKVDGWKGTHFHCAADTECGGCNEVVVRNVRTHKTQPKVHVTVTDRSVMVEVETLYDTSSSGAHIPMDVIIESLRKIGYSINPPGNS